MQLFDELRRFAQTACDPGKTASEINNMWAPLRARILAMMGVEGDIEKALADHFRYNVPSLERARAYFLDRIKKDLKRMAASMDPGSSDEQIAASLAKRIELSIESCAKRLKASMRQDQELAPHMDEWRRSGDPKSFDAVCDIFDSAMRNYATWANPGSKPENMDTELMLQRSELMDAVKSFYMQRKNPSPSSFLANWLCAKATKKRRSEQARMRKEELSDFSAIQSPDTARSPEEILFSAPTLGEQIKESFGISAEEFAKLIISVGTNIQDRGKAKKASEVVERLLDYKCGKDFPLEMRIYAVYLRDAKDMGLPEICKALGDEPFGLEGLSVKKLADVMNKFREKARKRLAAGLSDY